MNGGDKYFVDTNVLLYPHDLSHPAKRAQAKMADTRRRRQPASQLENAGSPRIRLASAADMDKTCCLGLGYPDGPIERVVRGGLAYHHEVTRALFETFGTPGYAPPRRAVAAKRRREP